jgi:hypothetical protein
MSRPVSSTDSKLTYGRRIERLHHYPACVAAKAQEDETILGDGILSHIMRRFVHLDPPGLNGPGRFQNWFAYLLRRLHHGTLDDNTSCHVFPQSNQKFSRKSNDIALLHAPAARLHSRRKPKAER